MGLISRAVDRIVRVAARAYAEEQARYMWQTRQHLVENQMEMQKWLAHNNPDVYRQIDDRFLRQQMTYLNQLSAQIQQMKAMAAERMSQFASMQPGVDQLDSDAPKVGNEQVKSEPEKPGKGEPGKSERVVEEPEAVAPETEVDAPETERKSEKDVPETERKSEKDAPETERKSEKDAPEVETAEPKGAKAAAKEAEAKTKAKSEVEAEVETKETQAEVEPEVETKTEKSERKKEKSRERENDSVLGDDSPLQQETETERSRKPRWHRVRERGSERTGTTMDGRHKILNQLQKVSNQASYETNTGTPLPVRNAPGKTAAEVQNSRVAYESESPSVSEVEGPEL